MRNRCRIGVVVLAALAASFVGPAAKAAEDFDFHQENVMGTSLELRVRADSPEAARSAEDRVLAEIDRLSAIFSGYDPNSEFSRWQAKPSAPVPVSREFFEMLQASDLWRTRSGGAFDPRVQVLSRIWTRAAELGSMPKPEEIGRALTLMQAPAWRLDAEAQTAERLGSSTLSLNAIAKGFIVERASSAALDPKNGIRGLALNVGGDLRVCGVLDLTIGIVSPSADSESSEPLAYIEVRDRAVATSGRSQRGFRIGAKWYSHILDPRSGMPAGHVASATVIAERSADADALATICNVLEPEASVRLVESLPGVECLIVTTDGKTTRSKGWSRYDRLAKASTLLASAREPEGNAAGAAAKKSSEATTTFWGDQFELVVDFEINNPDSAEAAVEKKGERLGDRDRDAVEKRPAPRRRGARGRYRRPYVVVWVEDKEGFPVRNLILWVSQGGAGPFQWLPDLKRWFAGDRIRKKVDKKDMVLTLARPTRPPGKYSTIWNGKDSKGQPLPPGEYTISIEAAREHGTYQAIRKKVTIGDKPFAETLDGGIEIKSAGITYRAKGKAE